MFLKGIFTLLLCAVLAILTSILLNYLTVFKTNHYWISLALFMILFLVLNVFYNNKSDLKTYSQMLLGTIAVKLIVFLMALVLYWLFNKQGLLVFFIHFSAHYILFTVFEIRYLLHIIKNRPTHIQ